jgi:rhodanese-related sulfurtransferase
MEDITTEELRLRLDKGELLNILDVREPFEHEEFNIGGKLIPLGTLPAALSELDGLKNEEIIVHCRSGARSANAKAFLESAGFTKVRNLLGGMMDWQLKSSS